mgnify:CR=1 FL=1
MSTEIEKSQSEEYQMFDAHDTYIVGKIVKSKILSTTGVITELTYDAVLGAMVSVGTTHMKTEYLLKHYVFLDDTPCGKKNNS